MTDNLVQASTLEEQCQAHWKELRINSTEDMKAYIQALFEACENQSEIIIALYRMVFPDWDNISKIHGYPVVGIELWKFIARQFQNFDRKHHPNLMPGGCWMNQGFSSDPELDQWEISFAKCKTELTAIAS